MLFPQWTTLRTLCVCSSINTLNSRLLSMPFSYPSPITLQFSPFSAITLRFSPFLKNHNRTVYNIKSGTIVKGESSYTFRTDYSISIVSTIGTISSSSISFNIAIIFTLSQYSFSYQKINSSFFLLYNRFVHHNWYGTHMSCISCCWFPQKVFSLLYCIFSVLLYILCNVLGAQQRCITTQKFSPVTFKPVLWMRRVELFPTVVFKSIVWKFLFINWIKNLQMGVALKIC